MVHIPLICSILTVQPDYWSAIYPPLRVCHYKMLWLQSSSVNVVYVFEADSVEQIMPIRIYWIDFYDIETFPAMTGEEGLQLALLTTFFLF